MDKLIDPYHMLSLPHSAHVIEDDIIVKCWMCLMMSMFSKQKNAGPTSNGDMA